ncbi:MAG: hypothetical protein WCT46_04970 [Candidatus Gracilibacteria bacterium]
MVNTSRNTDEGPRGMSRRDFITSFAALVALASSMRLVPLPSTTTVELAPPLRPRIEFLGTTVEILDEKKFQDMHDLALQHLILKFSIPGKVIDATTHKERPETKDEYWHRAIEVDFRGVLCRMQQYMEMICRYGHEMGFNMDVLSYFGIEAGFDPLKRSHSGYCGLGQMGEDAIADVREKGHLEDKNKIQPAQMNPWYDLRYDPAHGIPNGVAYLEKLRDDFPKTILQLLDKFPVQIQKWLEPRLDAIEKQLGIKTKGASYAARYKAVIGLIIPDDIAIADPASFAIHSYNMGIAGVAKLVFLNFVDAYVRKTNLVTDSAISVVNLDSSIDPDSAIGAFGVDMSHPIRVNDTDAAKIERQTYLWQAFVFKEFMWRWIQKPAGGRMKIKFKEHDYMLQVPEFPLDYEKEIAETTTEIDVPAGLDLVKFAEYLQLDPSGINHHKAFRLKGNAAFVRAGAYYGDPDDPQYRSGTVKIRVPNEKLVQAQGYISWKPPVVSLYRIKKGDTPAGILSRIKSPDATQDRIFWGYNRMGRKATLHEGDLIALPSELEI